MKLKNPTKRLKNISTFSKIKIYSKNSLIKLEIAIGKGKKTHDKRATIKKREWERNKERVLKKNKA